MRGVVRRYLPEKRYGFILTGEVEAFFHLSVFDGQGPIPPLSGEEVEYELGEGTRAVSVVRMNVPLSLEGSVSSYDPVRGYGFIATDSGQYYLHKSEVIGGGIPSVGYRVHFYTTGDSGSSKKPRACYVTVF